MTFPPGTLKSKNYQSRAWTVSRGPVVRAMQVCDKAELLVLAGLGGSDEVRDRVRQCARRAWVCFIGGRRSCVARQRGGILTGARNVDVGGFFYDVKFVDGTCHDVFAGCDALSDFQFETFEGAVAAADALLKQVFVDVPSAGNFDTHPELTFGCTDASLCFARVLE